MNLSIEFERLSNSYLKMVDQPVGSRIRDGDGYCGTIRYVGSVAHAKNQADVYFGVEWDNKKRGKHDGSCVDKEGKLHRYFTCDETAGSFVKPNKIQVGRSFLEAMQERYVQMDAPLVAPDNIVPGAFVTTSKGNSKPIELVGETKIRKWQQIAGLEKIAMRSDTISSAGEELEANIGHMVEVDLQDNLIYEWKEVASLVGQMPLLSTLLLHGNAMEPFTPPVAASLPAACFAPLRVLALNGCRMDSWMQVARLEAMLPNLEELYLSKNSLADLPIYGAAAAGSTVFSQVTSSVAPAGEVTGFANLRVLDVSGCGLTSWNQVLSLAFLPRLQDLLLDENPLPSVSATPTGAFSTLQRMSISSTHVTSWADVDALNGFPALTYLRLSHVPLFKGKGASEVRPVVIARMANLAFFNGSKVQGRERMDSEKSYIRRVLRERTELEEGAKDVVALPHPRFEALHDYYKAEMLDFGRSEQGPNLASNMLEIVFKNLCFSSSSLEPLTKKVPGSVKVAQLKAMVKQLFKVPPPL